TVLIILVLLALGPLVILLFNALKSSSEVAQNPLGLPRAIHLENFVNAWTVGEFNTTTINSLILVVATVCSVLLFGGLAAYSLARLQPPGANFFMLYMLGGSTLPIWL